MEKKIEDFVKSYDLWKIPNKKEQLFNFKLENYPGN
jgi:hypothetical protein